MLSADETFDLVETRERQARARTVRGLLSHRPIRTPPDTDCRGGRGAIRSALAVWVHQDLDRDDDVDDDDLPDDGA